MTVNNSTPASLGSAGAARSLETENAQQTGRSAANGAASKQGNDDVHLSELVRSLRSLASESPERQQRMEQLARAHAAGAYQVNAEATASAIIDEALTG